MYGQFAPRRAIALSIVLLSLSACSYVKHTLVQAEYARLHNAEPGQKNLKHMLDRDTYFVIGQTVEDNARYTAVPLMVAAYSNRFKPYERVDTMHVAGAGTHFGLNLPEGDYQLLVFADVDDSRTFEPDEVIGQKSLSLNPALATEKVVDRIKIGLTAPRTVPWAQAIERKEQPESKHSHYYPAGTIRQLDDPLFSENMATMGMYDPASFLEQSPTMFYALEEDLGYKIPVVFVHGAGGSVRAFEPIVSRLDRERYKPWFFYYPSGGDLDQLAEFFHRIFLSGKVIRHRPVPIIVVAHSMGGLVVREALNRYHGSRRENLLSLVVTIASPFGGHPAAATGEKHGLIVLPSWRDLNPESRFIQQLFRAPLPHGVEHELLYAFDNPATLKLSKNSDGVVPLASQLRHEAQQQAAKQLGFESDHTGILENEQMIAYLLERLDAVDNPIPPSHLEVLQQGGFDVALSDEYSPRSKYVFRNLGKYWMAITTGALEPFNPEQEQFVRTVRGQEPASDPVVRDWIRFLREYPDLKAD